MQYLRFEGKKPESEIITHPPPIVPPHLGHPGHCGCFGGGGAAFPICKRPKKIGVCLHAYVGDPEKDVCAGRIVYSTVEPESITSIGVSTTAFCGACIQSFLATLAHGETLRLALNDKTGTFWDFKIDEITWEKEKVIYDVRFLGGSTDDLPTTEDKKLLCLRLLPNLGQPVVDYPGFMDGTYSDFEALFDFENVVGILDPNLNFGFLQIFGKRNEIQLSFRIDPDPVGNNWSFDLVPTSSIPLPPSVVIYTFVGHLNLPVPESHTFTVQRIGNLLHVESLSLLPANAKEFSGTFSIKWIS